MKRSPAEVADVAVPTVTVTWTEPATCAGATAVICVAELTAKLVAAVLPKVTALAPVKAEPVIVTDVPPPTGPDVGLMPVTDGAVTQVKSSADVVANEVPIEVVTVTPAVPAAAAGATAVICVSELTV